MKTSRRHQRKPGPAQWRASGALMLAAWLVADGGWAQPSEPPSPRESAQLTFEGEILERVDVSAVDGRGDLLVIGADEGFTIQVLERAGPERYVADPSRHIPLEDGDPEGEADVEGIAWGEEYVYVIGSHSAKRKRVDEKKKTVKENLARLYESGRDESREVLYRLRLDAEGRLVSGSLTKISLHDLIADNELLAPFQAIAGKENGIDVEGLAADGDDRLYLGFRGPVLRGGYVPVLVVKLADRFAPHEIRFVNLGGRGIRGMDRVEGGFLLIGGPTASWPNLYQVFFWDGENTVPGKDQPDAGSHVRAICQIPANDGAKAEGLMLLEETADAYRFLVVYDSVDDGDPTRFECERG